MLKRGGGLEAASEGSPGGGRATGADTLGCWVGGHSSGPTCERELGAALLGAALCPRGQGSAGRRKWIFEFEIGLNSFQFSSLDCSLSAPIGEPRMFSILVSVLG